MFEEWTDRLVTVVHSDPTKSITGRVVSCSGESLILKDICDAEGQPQQGEQIALCIRNPIYEKLICAKS